MKLLHVLAAAALLGSSGCASLQVQVDILNPVEVGRIAEDSRLAMLYFDVARSTPESIRKQVEDLRAKSQAVFNDLADQYEEAAGQPTNTDEAKSVLKASAADLRSATQHGGGLDIVYQRYEKVLNDQATLVRTAAGDAPFDQKGRLAKPIETALLKRQLAVDAAYQPILDTIRAAEQEAKREPAFAERSTAAKEAAREQKVAEVKLANSTITAGRTLTSSAFAYGVAAAGEEAWKPAFNRAFGDGKFGNSEIVLKLDRAGEFTVKGMLFDPSKVAAVASKATTQAVLIAAKIVGAPVALGSVTGTEDKKGMLQASDADLERQAVLLARDAASDAQEDSLRALARTILMEEGRIGSATAGDRQSAAETVKAKLESQANIIKLAAVK